MCAIAEASSPSKRAVETGRTAGTAAVLYGRRSRAVPAGDGRETDGVRTHNLELEDGTRADPPTFRSAPGVSWEPGDTIPLGERTLRVVAIRLDEGADGDPVSVLVVAQA